jgi:hypothetical protein
MRGDHAIDRSLGIVRPAALTIDSGLLLLTRRISLASYLPSRFLDGIRSYERRSPIFRLLIPARFSAIGVIIIRYNGTLERYAGDGVMVVFNDPGQWRTLRFRRCSWRLKCVRQSGLNGNVASPRA